MFLLLSLNKNMLTRLAFKVGPRIYQYKYLMKNCITVVIEIQEQVFLEYDTSKTLFQK